MDKKNNPNVLFGSITYKDKEQIDNLIDNMGFEQSYFYIVQSLKHAYQSGIFSLEESEIVSKSLRVFSSRTLEKK